MEAVRAAAPASARRQTWWVSVVDEITIPYCYWDGGSKAEFSASNIITGESVELPRAHTPEGHFSHPNTWVEPTYKLGSDDVVVRHGTSCGKAAFPHVYISRGRALSLGVIEPGQMTG